MEKKEEISKDENSDYKDTNSYLKNIYDNDRELLIYLSNLKNERFNLRRYSLIKDIPRSNVYDIMNRLEKNGFVKRDLGDNKITDLGEEYLKIPLINLFNEDKNSKKCYFCDYNKVLDIHHIIPRSEKGKDNKNNLMILCPNCHALIHRNNLKLIRIENKFRAINKLGEIIL